MSSIGQNYSADATGTTPAPTADTSSAMPAPTVALNTTPTCIVLDEPYKTGDLAPDVKYPHVYITTLFLNGPGLTMQISYEFGTMQGQWVAAPNVPTQTLALQGFDLVPFFTQQPTDATTPLWDQVETLMYKQVQASNARTAGTIQTVSTT